MHHNTAMELGTMPYKVFLIRDQKSLIKAFLEISTSAPLVIRAFNPIHGRCSSCGGAGKTQQ
jgi:hypothetical protein